MIRIQRVLYKISLVFIFGESWIPVIAQQPMGARSLGMGQVATALPNNEWAVFSNPAMMEPAYSNVGFYALQNYGFPELTDLSFSAGIPTGFGPISIGIHTYGDERFSESDFRTAAGISGSLMHAGISLIYHRLSFAHSYGSDGAWSMDLGIAAHWNRVLWMAATLVNINHAEYRTFKEPLSRYLSVGMAYVSDHNFILSAEVVKDVRFPPSYRCGLEVRPFDRFTVRSGITTAPFTYSGGFGYGTSHWQMNIGFQNHEYLGMSPGVDMMLRF